MVAPYAPGYVRARCLVLGCGNILLGDDGFGPAVAARLGAETLPAGVMVMDVGTGARGVLFDLLLSEHGPERIIVVDAVDRGRTPGEAFWLEIEDIPAIKTDDFTLHQAPTSNLLRELRDRRNTTVDVLACQAGSIPTEVQVGLSPAVEQAVERACAMIRQRAG
jgi:coenzyme F420 hydrogenase subunit delta